MALANFTVPFGVGLPQINNWSSPTQHPIDQPHQATAVNNLLYGPEGDDGQYYKNMPYAPPAQPVISYQQQRQQFHHVQRQNRYYQYRSRNNYLPPSLPKSASPTLQPPPQRASSNNNNNNRQATDFQSPTISSNLLQPNVQTFQQSQSDSISASQLVGGGNGADDVHSQSIANEFKTSDSFTESDHVQQQLLQPPLLDNQQPTFTRVNAGHGSNTQVHAILDYDDDDGDQFDDKHPTGNR